MSEPAHARVASRAGLLWPPRDPRLQATTGATVDLLALAGESMLLLYGYPGTSVSPEDGHHSPRLDDALHREFTSQHEVLRRKGWQVMGVSSQPAEQQRTLVAQAGLEHVLLHDPDARLGRELNLRTFTVNDLHWYCRTLVVIANGDAIELQTVRTADAFLTWLQDSGL